jgi:hypothetical protein
MCACNPKHSIHPEALHTEPHDVNNVNVLKLESRRKSRIVNSPLAMSGIPRSDAMRLSKNPWTEGVERQSF